MVLTITVAIGVTVFIIIICLLKGTNLRNSNPKIPVEK